jgi:hypothetical protein
MQVHTFTMFDNAQPKTFDFFAPSSVVGALVKPEAASKQTFHSLKGSPQQASLAITGITSLSFASTERHLRSGVSGALHRGVAWHRPLRVLIHVVDLCKND